MAQPDLSKLLRGRTSGLSIERLMDMPLAQEVTTHIRFELPERFGRPGRAIVHKEPAA